MNMVAYPVKYKMQQDSSFPLHLSIYDQREVFIEKMMYDLGFEERLVIQGIKRYKGISGRKNRIYGGVETWMCVEHLGDLNSLCAAAAQIVCQSRRTCLAWKTGTVTKSRFQCSPLKSKNSRRQSCSEEKQVYLGNQHTEKMVDYCSKAPS